MADDMSSIPPRVGALETELHTAKYRLSVLEDTHKDIPHRVAKVEAVAERMPQIEAKLAEQGDMIKRGFIMTHGILLGAGGMWAVFNVGPKILQFMGAR